MKELKFMRKQLEMLHKESKNHTLDEGELSSYSMAMVEIFKCLISPIIFTMILFSVIFIVLFH